MLLKSFKLIHGCVYHQYIKTKQYRCALCHECDEPLDRWTRRGKMSHREMSRLQIFVYIDSLTVKSVEYVNIEKFVDFKASQCQDHTHADIS